MINGNGGFVSLFVYLVIWIGLVLLFKEECYVFVFDFFVFFEEGCFYGFVVVGIVVCWCCVFGYFF